MSLSALRLRVAAVAAIALSVSCGGSGGAQTNNTVGPTAVLNGSTIVSSKNYWAAPNCGVKVELASDGGFRFGVTDTSSTTSSGGATWTASGTDGAVINFGTGLGGFVWVSSLIHISGSTSSKAFSADVTVTDSSATSQNLGTCSFTLQTGSIP